MVVFNTTTGRIRCAHDTLKGEAFTLMPMDHELSVAVLDDAKWSESARLLKLEKTGVVRIDRASSKKPVMASAPDMGELSKAQRSRVNGLVLGSDVEYQSYLDMIPLDNQSTMPDRPNYRYIRENMVPAFEIAATWLHDIGSARSKKREKEVRSRIKELNAMVTANTR